MGLHATKILIRDTTEDGRTDAELVSAVRRGEKSAFAAIMRRYNRLLFRAARGIVDNDYDAQDVVQESYLRAFTGIGSFRGDSALGTWLARICINTALSAQRKKGRVVSLDDISKGDVNPTRFNGHLKQGTIVPEVLNEKAKQLQQAIQT